MEIRWIILFLLVIELSTHGPASHKWATFRRPGGLASLCLNLAFKNSSSDFLCYQGELFPFITLLKILSRLLSFLSRLFSFLSSFFFFFFPFQAFFSNIIWLTFLFIMWNYSFVAQYLLFPGPIMFGLLSWVLFCKMSMSILICTLSCHSLRDCSHFSDVIIIDQYRILPQTVIQFPWKGSDIWLSFTHNELFGLILVST